MEKELKEAIRLLTDLAELQNGAPLVTYEKQWNKTMEDVWEFIDIANLVMEWSKNPYKTKK